MLKEVKYLGIINNMKKDAKEQTEKKAKKAIKGMGIKAISSVLAAMLPAILPIIIIAAAGTLLYGLIDLGIELFTAQNNPKLIYDELEIEDVAELFTIKGNEENGYYLDFIDGIDEKLEDIITKYNKSAEYHNIPQDVNFLKKLLKAEVITQFPDLKGTIPESSEDGFQGAISIRRVTPNKSLRRDEEYWKRRNING